MADFRGKVCFVTGASNGIGRAIVAAFHAAGARVVFCDVEAPEEPLAGTLFRQVDVRDAGALQAFLREVGEVDILVNNVGVGTFSPLAETSIEQFDEILATNLRPVFITAREMAVRRKGVKKYGRILNIASTRYLQSEPGTEGYSASKGGIVSLTHALALSFAGTGVTVNCISPGWIDTGHYGELRSVDHAQHPSGRVGVPADIARLCLFLAAPENDFIDGQNFVVDGGMTKKMIYAE